MNCFCITENWEKFDDDDNNHGDDDGNTPHCEDDNFNVCIQQK